jgi:thymidylate synthase (FAD)
MFEPIELRKQCDDNRQSSTEVFNPTIRFHATTNANEVINGMLGAIKSLYVELLNAGVAREQARMILPLTTKTKIFMTGSIRSWIHFLQLRDDEHAQKEIQLVAKEAKSIFKDQFPLISKALKY